MNVVSRLAGAALATAIVSLSLLASAPAFAMQNENGGGLPSQGDIEGQGYTCIAQNPKNGMVWCVRDVGEGTFVCTPDGQVCYPSPPGGKPPWAVVKQGGSHPARIPGGVLKPLSR